MKFHIILIKHLVNVILKACFKILLIDISNMHLKNKSHYFWTGLYYMLVREGRRPIADALGLRFSCTSPSMWSNIIPEDGHSTCKPAFSSWCLCDPYIWCEKQTSMSSARPWCLTYEYWSSLFRWILLIYMYTGNGAVGVTTMSSLVAPWVVLVTACGANGRCGVITLTAPLCFSVYTLRILIVLVSINATPK